ncbi:hypothetical protein, partial [Xenorhabdus szentirmaii]|uniref:hypothetical protein n=1 Tax=Xenorhabdus szentirmaii TaxID=290112 RepID=UPI002B40B210
CIDPHQPLLKNSYKTIKIYNIYKWNFILSFTKIINLKAKKTISNSILYTVKTHWKHIETPLIFLYL